MDPVVVGGAVLKGGVSKLFWENNVGSREGASGEKLKLLNWRLRGGGTLALASLPRVWLDWIASGDSVMARGGDAAGFSGTEDCKGQLAESGVGGAGAATEGPKSKLKPVSTNPLGLGGWGGASSTIGDGAGGGSRRQLGWRSWGV